MKLILTIITCIILTGCFEESKKQNLKYKLGDEVYLKPDSTIAYISDTSKYNLFYRVGYVNKQGNINYTNVDEFVIYGKKKTE